MKKLFGFTVFVMAVGLLVLGCEKAPNPTAVPLSDQNGVSSLAKASTFTDNVSVPFDLTVSVDCANGGTGELIQLSGLLHILFHETVNGNHFNFKAHFQPQGLSGVGLTTGDKYQGTGGTQYHDNGSFVNGKYSFTYVNNFRMIGQGPGNNFTVHETFHFTINANGTVTAEVDNFKIECK